MSKLKKSEKMLLYILACVVIFTCGSYFLVTPMLQQYNANQEALALALDDKMQMELTNPTLASSKATISQLEKKVTELEQNISVPMENYEIDRLITGMSLKRNLAAQSLLLSAAVPSAEATAPAVVTGETTAAAVATPQLLNTVQISLSVSGTESDMMLLADDFAKMPQIKLVAFSLTDGTGSFELELYML
ncbi:MAG: hypothetical protein WCI30_05250 [Clostridia bacterium]